MDLESLTRWDGYSNAKDEMFFHTDTDTYPGRCSPRCPTTPSS